MRLEIQRNRIIIIPDTALDAELIRQQILEKMTYEPRNHY